MILLTNWFHSTKQKTDVTSMQLMGKWVNTHSIHQSELAHCHTIIMLIDCTSIMDFNIHKIHDHYFF